MSEITKLYENAGVKSFKTCEFCTQKSIDCLKENISNITCGFASDMYPPFTAQKQLEIMKFLLKKAVYYDVKDDKYWFYYEECESAGYKPFDEAIAHFINKLWTDLTIEEKQQVKGILE